MDENPLVKGLNKPQKEAVLHTDGPLLILAGAGSGKTRVMTHRIANLVKYHGVSPSHILAVTFTNKAANEMRERIEALLTNPMKRTYLPYLGTFHSVCARILRQEAVHAGIPKTFTILDDEDQRSIIKEIMEKLSLSPEELNPRFVISVMSRAKDDLITPAQFAQTADSPAYQQIADIYPKYQAALKKRGSLDFGDLLAKTAVMLQQNKDVLKRYQNRFKYVLVDEYQDTNHAQYLIVSKFANKHKNIAVCGDDDQSIYAWRGATVQNILSFEEEYPGAKVIKLEQNYRSTAMILDAAYSVIKNNMSRKDKRLWTDNNKGDKISQYIAYTEQDEASFVAKKIEQLQNEGVRADEIAILYRTNAQSRNLEEAMIMSQIPYRIIGGFRFYQRKEVKDILAYIRFLINTNDTDALFRAINTPARGIGTKTLNKLRELSDLAKTSPGSIVMRIAETSPEEKKLELEKQVFGHKGIRKFSQMISRLSNEMQKMTPREVVEAIVERTKYIQHLEKDKQEAQSRIENLDELMNAASRYDETKGMEGLHQFITDIALMEKEDDSENAAIKRVSLMTLHSAKGLEFDVVFMVGMEEKLLPHSNSMNSEKDIEEERRLCYVGITRAKKKLFFTRANRRTLYGKRFDTDPSRFIFEIEDKMIEEINDHSDEESDSHWTDNNNSDLGRDSDHGSAGIVSVESGQRVKHPEFGIGVVVSVDDDVIYVTFGDGDKKAFIAEYARLEKI